MSHDFNDAPKFAKEIIKKHNKNFMENEIYNQAIDTFAAQFMNSESLEEIEDLLKELPIDWDSRVTGWNDFIKQMADALKK